nr:fasciclin domain-containing protein [Devosia sp.]
MTAMTLSLRALSVAAMLTIASVGGAMAQDNPMVGGAAMLVDKNIVENAANSADHTTLVAAVKAAGLVETLSGPGPFTVLAPVNAAFDALPAGTVDNLLKPENKDTLSTILACHVIPAKALSSDIASMVKADGSEHVVDTVGGCKLTLKDVDGKITVTDENGTVANVTIADVLQSNGVIHVIDAVLTPKSAM